MALQKNGISFNPFFQHRLAEIQENLKTISSHVKVLEVIKKIDGKLNPADLTIRNHAKPEDLKPNGSWQKGPLFLCEPRNTWPLTDTQ